VKFAPLAIALLVAAQGAAQRPETRAAIAEIERLVATAKQVPPSAKGMVFGLLAPLAERIAKEHPAPTALERRAGAGKDYETRVAMRAALASACDRLRDELVAALLSDEEAPQESARSIVQSAGAEALVVAGLVDAVGGADPAVRKRAILTLFWFSDEADPTLLRGAAPVLGKALSDEDEEVRQTAALILADLGPFAAPAKEALVAAIAREPASLVGQDAALALHKIDPRDRTPVPSLMAMLDRDGKATNVAIEALREIGPGAEAALPLLVPRATPDHEGSFAVRAIAAIDQGGPAAVPVLVEAAAKNDAARGLAIGELVRRAPTSAGARAWLESQLAGVNGGPGVVDRYCRAPADPDASFGVFEALFEAAPSPDSLARALARAGVDCRRGLPLLLKGLAVLEPSSSVPWIALFGPEAAAALPWLRQLLRDPRPGVRGDVVAAMTQIDPSGRLILDDLIFRLADESEYVRNATLEAIARLGPDAARATPAIEFRLRDSQDEGERDRARRALAAVRKTTPLPAPVALPVLIDQLRSEEPEARGAAARAIREMGPAASAAVPALCVAFVESTQSPHGVHSDLTTDLICALRSIGPAAKSALPILARAGGDCLEVAIDWIDPPARPPLQVREDASLRVCRGRWTARGFAGECLRPVRAQADPDPSGRRIIVTAPDLGEPGMCGPGPDLSVVIFVSRSGAGSPEVTASKGHDVIRSGTVTFRSLAFGKGRPLEGVLTFEQGGNRHEVAFACEDRGDD
jgi:HEAT repeat protein